MPSNPIRDARQRAGLTQLRVCADAGLSIKTLATAERWGPRAVSHESLKKIATALRVPLEQLTAEGGFGAMLDAIRATMGAAPRETAE